MKDNNLTKVNPLSNTGSDADAGRQSSLRLVRTSVSQNTESLIPDRVIQTALDREIISGEDLKSVQVGASSVDGNISWRQVAVGIPNVAESLRELAAETYGFRQILICEVGTLVYNDLLTAILSPTEWQMLVEENVIPVLEYGDSPHTAERHRLGSPDPGSPAVRELVQGLSLPSVELVYVSASTVTDLQDLLLTHLASIRMVIQPAGETIVREIVDVDMDVFEPAITRRAA